MEKYSDLITNGLDLLSFLLVTPEIVKLVAPTARLLIALIIVWLFGCLMTILGMLGFLLMGYFRGDESVLRDLREISSSPAFQLGLIGAILVITIVMAPVYRPMIGTRAGLFASRATKHLLAFGVILFFVSRLIAFYGSAAKAGLL